MSISILPNNQSNVSKKEQVQNMFDEIAPKYDFLNHLLSFNIDKIWRKNVLKILRPSQPKYILDVATGTADLAIALAALQPTEIIGMDLSRKMLDAGQLKIENKQLEKIITLEQGDSEQLKYNTNQFDAVTVAFGVRNFEHLEKGLAEINRVLKPNGTFVILEFSKVKVFPLKQLYQFYSRYIMPAVGKFFSSSTNAYSYLPNSVEVFPEGEELCLILQRVGFKNIVCKPQTFGVATIYIAQK
jgi:demethylmenaquinone methyltransferase/2-methoxy-6-polyprenyl-1,4-benzoquinol methylase